jgi:hypothetical protein
MPDLSPSPIVNKNKNTSTTKKLVNDVQDNSSNIDFGFGTDAKPPGGKSNKKL